MLNKNHSKGKYYYDLGVKTEEQPLPYIKVSDTDQTKLLVTTMYQSNIFPTNPQLKHTNNDHFINNNYTNNNNHTNSLINNNSNNNNNVNNEFQQPSLLTIKNESESLLRNPLWKKIRERFCVLHSKFNSNDNYKYLFIIPGVHQQVTSTNFFNLKQLYLQDIDHTKDQVHKNCAISLTNVMIPISLNAIFLLAKDDKNDVIRVQIYGMDKREMYNIFPIGTRITLINPYLRIAQDGPLLRVDDPKSIIFNDSVSICHYCSITTNLQVCGRCNKAKYCCKECQREDYKIHKHFCN